MTTAPHACRTTPFPPRPRAARSVRAVWRLGWCLATLGMAAAAGAGEVRLKNSFVLHGRPTKLISLTHAVDPNPGPTTIYSIVMVHTGWQRYYVPMRQVPDDGVNLAADVGRFEEFLVDQQKQGRQFRIQNVGTISNATPFDEFGRRRVTLTTDRGPLHVVQGITRVTPDYVQVTGLTHVWDFGLGLSQLDPQIVDAILRNPAVCKPDDAQARMALARFFIQAEWYEKAFNELEVIGRDFPQLEQQVQSVRQDLLQLFGRHVLQELGRRRRIAQHQLADEHARKLVPAQIGGAVQRDVERFLAENLAAVETLDKVRALLGELPAKVTDSKLVEKLKPLRSALLGELDREGLVRLQPFLQAESDPQLSADEKLALAYSGWVLGVDGADTDLARAVRMWDARFLVQEYCRAEAPADRAQVFEELRVLEGVAAATLLRLLKHLPPPLPVDDIRPGEPRRIEVAGASASPAAYHVLLPPEYTPNHAYPCLVALRPAEKTPEGCVAWWGGADDQPGWTQRRGYILLVPEYAPADQRDYTYSPAAHETVLRCLRDARLRFAIDSDRVFLAGHALGGDAAFDIGMTHPDEFAGVIPIGGVYDHYANFYLGNGKETAWYVVRGDAGRDSVSGMHPLLDRMFDQGAKYDLIYAQYLGRGLDWYPDELPKLFDWMDLHRRGPPSRDFKYRSLRKTDNQLHWVTALGLPRNYVLPLPPGARVSLDVMEIEGRITDGNTIYVRSPATGHRLRLFDGLIDPEKRLSVRINGRPKSNKFVETDLRATLEDFLAHGDRQRLATAVLEF